MSQIWREKTDPTKHLDFMSNRNEAGVPIEAPQDNLLETWVYFARVCNFTFQFASIEQVLDCRQYFSTSIHPSTREKEHGLEHYWHPWYSRLPKGLHKEVKRQKVLKALNQILARWGASKE